MGAETAEVPPEIMSPGKRLRAAREAHNIDISDIARWLKLDEKTINALECDDDAHLPEPVFTAGYIRSYARLVELPADELVDEYMRGHKDQEPAIEPKQEPLPGRQSKVDEALPKNFSIATAGPRPAYKKWLGIGTVAVVFIAALAWVVAMWFAPEENASVQNAAQAGAGSQTGEEQAPVEDQVDQLPADRAASDIEQAAQGETQERITVPLPLNKIERGDPGFVVTLDEDGTVILPSQPQTEIALEFVADSWIEIRDATGKIVLRRLGIAGTTKEVSGVAPFQVLIGYGPGVKMEYDGEPFDFSKFQGQQEVARFTLPAPKDKQPQ
jgi:cytoskeleton protein RodZ